MDNTTFEQRAEKERDELLSKIIALRLFISDGNAFLHYRIGRNHC